MTDVRSSVTPPEGGVFGRGHSSTRITKNRTILLTFTAEQRYKKRENELSFLNSHLGFVFIEISPRVANPVPSQGFGTSLT